MVELGMKWIIFIIGGLILGAIHPVLVVLWLGLFIYWVFDYNY